MNAMYGAMDSSPLTMREREREREMRDTNTYLYIYKTIVGHD